MDPTLIHYKSFDTAMLVYMWLSYLYIKSREVHVAIGILDFGPRIAP